LASARDFGCIAFENREFPQPFSWQSTRCQREAADALRLQELGVSRRADCAAPSPSRRRTVRSTAPVGPQSAKRPSITTAGTRWMPWSFALARAAAIRAQVEDADIAARTRDRLNRFITARATCGEDLNDSPGGTW